MNRLRRLLARGENGVTVIELVVTMAIFSIVSVAMFNFLDQTTKISSRTERHAEAEGNAQLALRQVTQNLRSAAPITGPCAATTDTATPSLPAGYKDCIRLSVSRNDTGGSSCARSDYVYALVPAGGGTSNLVENRQDFTGTTTCTAGPIRLRRILLTNVINTSAQPLFTYYAADGAAIDTVLNAAKVPGAVSVKTTLRVRYDPNANPLLFTSVAAPRNNR